MKSKKSNCNELKFCNQQDDVTRVIISIPRAPSVVMKLSRKKRKALKMADRRTVKDFQSRLGKRLELSEWAASHIANPPGHISLS